MGKRCIGCGKEFTSDERVLKLTESWHGKKGSKALGTLCSICSSGVLNVPSVVLREIKQTAKRTTIVRKKAEPV